MNVDTGEFHAICNQVADIGCDVGDLECRIDELGADLAQNDLYMVQMAQMMSRMLRGLLPAVNHATHLTRQPGPPGRHRRDSGPHRPDNRLPHCREAP